MVKSLDYQQTPKLLDHIGWRLWQASEIWKERFQAEMVLAGYAWFAEARANVIPYLDRKGTRQTELVGRMGVSKQAIQQFIDDLVADGIVKRQPAPDDGRGKTILFTKEGLMVLNESNRVKRAIQKEYEKRLGKTKFQQFYEALTILHSPDSSPAENE